SVRTIRRVEHARAPAASDETIDTVEFSDGFGRLVQTRTQAEDEIFDSGLVEGTAATGVERMGAEPNVVVSGWQVYDNKGRVVDALGRVVETVERNGPDDYVTRSTYDVRGNLLEVVDALGRPAFRHDYDVANRRLSDWSLDGGAATVFLNAAGDICEKSDAKG